MRIEEIIREGTFNALKDAFRYDGVIEKITINLTPPEFDGDLTVVVFPFLKYSKKSPEATAEELGALLKAKIDLITEFNVVKGFLNIVVSDSYWVQFLLEYSRESEYGKQPRKDEVVVLEYCGPNTNKPLHLGHIRNMLLGHAVSEILEFNGYEVHKVNIYNDRGIAICKSMVAWLENGNGQTPISENTKGDHFVGRYYVEFDRILQKEVESLPSELPKDEIEKQAPIYKKAQDTLRLWEGGDPETIKLWKEMNNWVYKGFQETYMSIGVNFEKDYFESETYQLGKALVLQGLKDGVFIQKEDGSVWVDLSGEGLDEKILLRSDGTSVYLTQDLGTAQLRFEDYNMDRSVYVVGDEQDYHFKVLKLTLNKIGKPYAVGIHHLSYGMVDLPSGKMKSREGTVVDADDLINDMLATAEKHTLDLGKIDGFNETEGQSLYRIIGLAALKFFILKVDPRKRMMFDPEDSIDFHGQTGPFIQYTYARIKSILRNAGDIPRTHNTDYVLSNLERGLIIHLHQFPQVVMEAGREMDPSGLCQYTYQLARIFNKFYTEHSILKAESSEQVSFRLVLSNFVQKVLKESSRLLGMEMPERM